MKNYGLPNIIKHTDGHIFGIEEFILFRNLKKYIIDLLINKKLCDLQNKSNKCIKKKKHEINE